MYRLQLAAQWVARNPKAMYLVGAVDGALVLAVIVAVTR